MTVRNADRFAPVRVLFAILALTVLALLLTPALALAQEAAAAGALVQGGNTRVSLAPIFDYAFNVIGVVVPPVLVLLIRHYVAKWFNVKLEAGAAAALQIALEKGTSMAISKARAQSKKIEDVDVHNALAATVANYAIARTPDAIARFKITPAELKDMAIARIEDRVNPRPIVAVNGAK